MTRLKNILIWKWCSYIRSILQLYVFQKLALKVTFEIHGITSIYCTHTSKYCTFLEFFHTIWNWNIRLKKRKKSKANQINVQKDTTYRYLQKLKNTVLKKIFCIQNLNHTINKPNFYDKLHSHSSRDNLHEFLLYCFFKKNEIIP